MDPPTHSASLQVLAMPELLHVIFGFSDDASNAANARVCKRWSDVALDRLWYHVQDISRLFEILAPLNLEKDGSFTFGRALRLDDWKAFERYSFRVKSLSYVATRGKPIHQIAFNEIARSRTSLNILPNTHTLEWDASPDLCMIFAHQNLKSFTIRLPEDEIYDGFYIEEIGERMQSLTHLDLGPGHLCDSIGEIEPHVINLLSNLINLRRLTIPFFCFTSKIAEAASRIPELESIECRRKELEPDEFEGDTDDFAPVLQEGAYPSLRKLDLSVPFYNAASFLYNPFAPADLTELCVDCSPSSEGLEDILRLTTAIGEICQRLKSLTLISPATDWDDDLSDDLGMTIDHFRPLLKGTNLTSFYVSHACPLALRLVDIEEIAKAWPRLESLTLNNEPYYYNESELGLDALLLLARSCPNLRELGLFLDTAKPINKCSTYPRFHALRRLAMGCSIILDEASVALFLSHICPPGCEIAPIDFGVGDRIIPKSKKLNAINKWLPVLLECRKIGRDEAERSKREADDLSTKTASLILQ